MNRNLFRLLFILLFFQTIIISSQTDPGTENLIHYWNFEDGTVSDEINMANGILMEGAEIVDGDLIIDAENECVELPSQIIKINQYSELTFSIWFQPSSAYDVNTAYHAIWYFGDSVNRMGSNGIYLMPARGDNLSHTAISTGNLYYPWKAENYANAWEVSGGDQGDSLYHFVTMINEDYIALYVNGILRDTANLTNKSGKGKNSIALLSNNYAWIGKGGYISDPVYQCTVHEFSIYNKQLSDLEILYLYQEGPIEKSIGGLSKNALLSDLKIDSVTVKDFSSVIFEYNDTLPEATIKIPVVTATTYHDSATIQIIQADSLPGRATIFVTAQDSNYKQTYTIDFLLEQSHDASLSALFSGGNEVAGFNPNSYIYDIILPAGTTQVPVVSVITNHPKATYVINYTDKLPGSTIIKVMAENGDSLRYYINYTLELSTDATLSSVIINGDSLDGFDPEKYTYNIKLKEHTVIIPDVSVILSDKNATFYMINTDTLPGTTIVKVTAEDEKTFHIYAFYFSIALSDDATISNIKINNNILVDFQPDKYEYSIELPAGTITVPIVDVVLTDPDAKVFITPPASLPGTTIIVITAADGITTKTYRIEYILSDGIVTDRLETVKIYPNPVKNLLYLTGYKNAMVYLFNSEGKNIFNGIINQDEYKVDMSESIEGIYFVWIYQEVKTTTFIIYKSSQPY